MAYSQFEKSTLWNIREDQIERFELLGSGTFGAVYKVIWTKDDGEKVIAAGKYFRPLTAKDAEDIEKEIGVLSDINHPNIIKCYGAVRGESDTILVTEYAAGGSLRNHLKEYSERKEKISLEQALKWAREAALALEYLHGRNLTHRDVKSNNFVLMEDGVLKLCDFGFARELYSTYETTRRRGTLVYKSPELLKDGEVTDKVDVYAYGIFLWELLTCKTPYKGFNSDKVRSMVLAKERLTVPDDCSIIIKTVLKECWSHEREDRPDMGEVVAIIDQERDHMQLKSFRETKQGIQFHAKSITTGNAQLEKTSQPASHGYASQETKNDISQVKASVHKNDSPEETSHPATLLENVSDDVGSNTPGVVPSSMKEWSVDVVSIKLRTDGIAEDNIQQLHAGGVDGKILMDYTLKDFIEDFPKIIVGQRRAILRAIQKYRDRDVTVPQLTSTGVESTTPTSEATTIPDSADVEVKAISSKSPQPQHIESSVLSESTMVPSSVTTTCTTASADVEEESLISSNHQQLMKPENAATESEKDISTNNKQGCRPKDNTRVQLKSKKEESKEVAHLSNDPSTAELAYTVKEDSVREQKRVPGQKKKMLGEKEKHLRKLLLGAEQQHFDQSYYPVLFTNKPAKDFKSEDFEFLTNIKWTAVFDFDPESNNSGLCKEFCKARKPNLSLPDTLKDTDIELSDSASWIFCNGRSDLEIDEYARSQWHQKRRDFVEDVIKGYEKIIPPERGVVIFLIQSDDNIGVLADSFSKTCSSFHGLGNVTCIVADDNLYEKWEKEVIGTNCCKAEELRKRSMIGLQVSDINVFMQRMANVNKATDLYLSMGSAERSILLDRRKLDSWHQISVLAKNETENTDMSEDHPDFEEFHTGKEISFYRGHKVEWWNFALTEKKYNKRRGFNHVLRRSKCDELRSMVEKALEGDDYIQEVNIFHQAGSGGTTMGRQVLWDLHRHYRCAVVKSVNSNDTRTAEEILQLRKYGYHDDESSKPVLILADDLEVSEVEKLREDLTYCSRDMNIRGALCVIVSCSRTSDPTSSLADAAYDEGEAFVGVPVLHKLEEAEQKWFEKKYTELEGRAIEKNTTAPQNLMGFMIMKVECSSEYIQGVVSRAMKDLETNFPTEYDVVKYAGLLNKYNPTAGIPITSCDTLFHSGIEVGRYAYRGRSYRGNDFKHWEHKLSPSSNLLLIRVETFVPHCSSVMTMKVVGQNVADAIVMYLCQKQTLAELALDFLKSKVMSSSVASRDKHLKPQVHNLLFQRQQSSDKFSPMMEDIIRDDKHGDENMALTIFDVAYDCLNDPFCAQQAARLLYIKDNNYAKAHVYIDRALADKPNKMSFLWDTKGQIFRKQINEEFTKVYLKDNQPDLLLKDAEATKLVHLTFSAISAFRKSQEASRQENQTNLAGYVGEADVSLQMLEILQRCMQIFRSRNGEVFHNYLLTEEVPSSIPTDWLEFHKKFQHLRHQVDDALHHIAGKDTFFKQYTSKRTSIAYEFRKDQKRKLDRQYQRAFGRPPSSRPPTKPKDKAEWNRGRIIDMGAGKFHDIFELIRINKTDNVPQLREALQLTLENNPPNYSDILRLICITLALSSTGDKHVQHQLLLVDTLYDYATKMRENSFQHDIYGPFFLLMFVWPHPRASTYRIVKDTIKVYISDLKKHYRDNKSKYWKDNLTTGEYIRPATFFFLGNGGGLKQFVHIYELSATSKQLEGDRFWEATVVKERLTQLEGNLYNKSTLLYKTPLGDQLEIQLSKPKTRVSQEKVTFYLGFSWSGPIAYNVKYVDRSTTAKLQIFNQDHKALLDRFEQHKELEDLQQKKIELEELESVKRGGATLTHKQKQKLKELPVIRSKIRKIMESSQ